MLLMTTIGYVRTSVATTGSDGLGVQRERIAGWCAYQGIALDGIEEDEGISGASTDGRRGFKRAVRRVLQAGSGSILVVYKLDRLGRNALDVQETLAVLLDAGVRVVAIADGVDSASGMGAALLKLLTGVLATFAELERETIITRMQGGRAHKRRKGEKYSREPSYGHVHGEGKALVPVEEEARAVERIKALRSAGSSYRAIVATLEAEGVKPRHAERWSLAVVHNIATGERAGARRKTSARIVRARAAFLEIGEAAE
jgi:site-specific DNA recombinase